MLSLSDRAEIVELVKEILKAALPAAAPPPLAQNGVYKTSTAQRLASAKYYHKQQRQRKIDAAARRALIMGQRPIPKVRRPSSEKN